MKRITKSKTLYVVHTEDPKVRRICHTFQDALRWMIRYQAKGYTNVGPSRHYFTRGNYQLQKSFMP